MASAHGHPSTASGSAAAPTPTPTPQHPHHHHQHQQSGSTPSLQGSTVAKRDLTSWWKRFNTRTPRREEEKGNLSPTTSPPTTSTTTSTTLPIVAPVRPAYYQSRFREVWETETVNPPLPDKGEQSRESSWESTCTRPEPSQTAGARDPNTRNWFKRLVARTGRHLPSSRRPSATYIIPPYVDPSRASSSSSHLSWSDAWQIIDAADLSTVPEHTGIFGVPLAHSIKYANVAISLTDGDGKSFIYGYVPIVVAKCGVFLKEQATEIEGIFRLSGSARRIKELQTMFDSPDRYGKGLVWEGYTVHDAANVLRRYLNQLPEPIIPLTIYEKFRDPVRGHQFQAVGDTDADTEDVGDFNEDYAIKTFQNLITKLPPLNRQLLLYILDLLAVFASKSDMNRMTAPNLAAIFQPGILSHPDHDMSPQEYRLSQNVLVFLIENQDHFLIGMRGTAADEDTVREVQSGATPQATTPTSAVPNRTRTSIARSSSNASAGAESVRKYGGMRRNVSVSSKHSKQSNNNAPSPVSPGHPSSSTGGVHRSNTVPSKKSPGLVSTRFNKPSDPPTPTSATLAPPGMLAAGSSPRSASPTLKPTGPSSLTHSASSTSPTPPGPGQQPSAPGVETQESAEEKKLFLDPAGNIDPQSTSPGSTTPSKEKNWPSFFARSPTSDTEKKDLRPRNRLRKKNLPGSAHQSAHSSSNSLHGDPTHQYQPPPNAADPGSLSQLETITSPTEPHTTSEEPAPSQDLAPPRAASGGNLRPLPSPVPSFHSHSSVTDHSDFELASDEPHGGAASSNNAMGERRRHRWRLSSSHKSDLPKAGGSASGSGPLGVIPSAAANNSASSVDSANRPRKSITNDSQSQPPSSEPSTVVAPAQTAPAPTPAPAQQQTPQQSTPQQSGHSHQPSAGPLGWFKAKVREHKEERREREAEKERAKSPPPAGPDKFGSRQSLPPAGPVVEGVSPARGKSMDVKREADAPAAAVEKEEEIKTDTAVPGAESGAATAS
ncbi:MAG: hypothetical protein M4579_007320 [Chaenotheca gracillima]|nr:MAG: hypothetical protein M4579_007320 [Chaenotheca gracillima]